MTQMLIETYQMFFKLVLVYPEHVHHLALNLVAVSLILRDSCPSLSAGVWMGAAQTGPPCSEHYIDPTLN